MITQADFYILNAIQGMRTGFLDFVMPIVTYLGSGGIIWIAAAVIMLFFKRTRKAGIMLLAVLAAGWLLSTCGLKNIIARERPFNVPGALFDSNTLLIGVPSGRYSFPSGHALSSFSAATILFYLNRKAGAAAYFLASLIAFSRLYLYVHFPTDVIFGAALGIVFAVLTILTSNRISEIKNERKLSDNSK